MSAAYVSVLAKPGSKSAGVAWDGERLTIRVRERAEDGKANEASRAALAAALGVPQSSVSLARGARSKIKLFAISGLTPDALAAKLRKLRS